MECQRELAADGVSRPPAQAVRQKPQQLLGTQVNKDLEQRFSTWGTRTRKKLTGGRLNLKKCSKEALLGRISDLGVCKGHTILIWRYAEGYNFDLGYVGTKKG